MNKKALIKKANQKSKISPKIVVSVVTVIATLFLVYFVYVAYKIGVFSDPKKMKRFLSGFGNWAPLIYALFQIIQVIIPMIPGATSTGLGLVIFGNTFGFILNFIIIVPCLMINFYLAKKYGWELIYKIFGRKQQQTIKKYLKMTPEKLNHVWLFKDIHKIMPDRTYKRMINWLTKKNGLYKILIFITMLIPGFPADLLCYTYGLTEVSYKNFLIILLITKPFSIIMLGLIVNGAFNLIG